METLYTHVRSIPDPAFGRRAVEAQGATTSEVARCVSDASRL
jgi:hypothetical protein